MVKKISVNEKPGHFDVSVACIGYFDGLHIGHQELIDRTIGKAEEKGCRSMVICFEPDPMELISGKKQKHILSYQERLERMEEFGVDDILVFRFDEKLMKMDAHEFIDRYLNRLNISELVCGFDFTFGYRGEGNSDLLRECGDFDVDVVEEIKYDGAKVSSTRIKREIESGNFRLVSRLLNYYYYLPLVVIKASRKGSKWLVEARSKDRDRVMPGRIEDIFDTVSYKDGIFYIESDVDAEKGEEFVIIFEDE